MTGEGEVEGFDDDRYLFARGGWVTASLASCGESFVCAGGKGDGANAKAFTKKRVRKILSY